MKSLPGPAGSINAQIKTPYCLQNCSVDVKVSLSQENKTELKSILSTLLEKDVLDYLENNTIQTLLHQVKMRKNVVSKIPLLAAFIKSIEIFPINAKAILYDSSEIEILCILDKDVVREYFSSNQGGWKQNSLMLLKSPTMMQMESKSFYLNVTLANVVRVISGDEKDNLSKIEITLDQVKKLANEKKMTPRVEKRHPVERPTPINRGAVVNVKQLMKSLVTDKAQKPTPTRQNVQEVKTPMKRKSENLDWGDGIDASIAMFDENSIANQTMNNSEKKARPTSSLMDDFNLADFDEICLDFNENEITKRKEFIPERKSKETHAGVMFDQQIADAFSDDMDQILSEII